MLRAGAETHLIVMVDSDGWSYADVRRQLLNTLDEPMRTQVDQNKRWFLLSPAWELENWVHCLEGRQVTEDRDLGLTLDRDKECRPAARKLADHCRNGTPIPNVLPSLDAACAEWRRYIANNDL